MEITISKSDKKDNKFKAIVEDHDRKKTVHFGQAGASDMTQHGDEKRKERYFARHKKNEDWTDKDKSCTCTSKRVFSDKKYRVESGRDEVIVGTSSGS